jgi:hypothetical protein
VPLIAADLARASRSPLPAILAMTLPELWFWHGEFCELV